jgi:hypothetical protein
MSFVRLKQFAQDGAATNEVITWDGTQWAPAAISDLDTETQEEIATQVITGTDTTLTANLSSTPTSNAAVRLFLNGVLQRQGATLDYTISGTAITWLAATGTAVDMDTADVLSAVYDA